MRKSISTIVCTIVFLTAYSQKNIDTTALVPMISATYSFYWPGGDLVNRFGNNSIIGAAFMVKIKDGWIAGIDWNYLFGNNVKEDGFLDGISTENGEIIGEDGSYAEVELFERGFISTVKAGKLFPVFGPNKNSGLILMGGAGLLQHNIRIDTEAPQLQGDYKKGYDRLTNGFALTEFIGYQYMGNNRLVNFYIGFEAIQAWTQNRRSYNFDTMEKDETRRIDILTGIRVGWIIPIYKKVPDEYYYY